MKRKMLSMLMALAMILSLLPVTALAAVEEVDDTETYFDDTTESFRIYKNYWADIVTEAPAGYAADSETKTVTIASAEALAWWAKQVNDGTNFAGYTVKIVNDIDLSGHYWTPIDTATIQFTEQDGKVSWTTVNPQKKLDGATIDGGGYTITGLATATGIRGPAQPSEPGDGQNCYYYSAFIGRNDGALTIQNVTFDNASIAITEPADGVSSNGSSMCAVVAAISSGALTLNSVTVSNSRVLAMQKASALLGMPSGGSFTVNKCAVTGCDIKGYFQVAPIAGYVGTNNFPLQVNGIKLDNNTTTIVKQKGWNYAGYNDGVYYGHDKYYGEDKYYIGASETAVMDNTGAVTVDGLSYSGISLPLVAEVDGYQYNTVSAAIDAAKDGQTVKLLKDTKENVSVVSGKNLTLDLNGKTLTEDKVMIVSGNLTIMDSTATSEPVVSSDYGTVTYDSGAIVNTRNESPWGDCHTIVVNGGGQLTLKSGAIQSTGNCGVYVNGNLNPESSEDKAPVNSKFTMEGGYIKALEFGAAVGGRGAALDISGGVIVAENNAAVAGNGTNSADAYYGGTAINISGGTIISHITAEEYIACGVYHPQKGELNISGGTIYADGGVGVLMRGGVLNMTDGQVIATGTASGKVGDSKVVANCYGIQLDAESKYYDHAATSVAIFGGMISSANGVDNLNVLEADSSRIQVSGGYFTSDPSAYVADGKAALPSDNGAYAFMVGDKATDVVALPATGEPVVDTTQLPAAMTEEDKTAVSDAAASVITSGELAAAANQAIGQVTEQQKADAEAALKNSSVETEGKTITIYAQTYLDITPTAYNKDKGVLTLNITPMYRVVASTATKAEDIKVIGEVEQDANAVVLTDSETELTGIKTMTISITLPSGFPTDNLYVKHTKDGKLVGYHTAAVDNSVLTFTNNKGFSTFEIKADSRAATVDFGGETGQISYTPANVGDTLPTAEAPAGQVFSGWTFQGIEGTYTSLTDDLLTKLAEKSGTITATAYFYTPSTGSTTYAITVKDGDNGTVTASRTRANKGLTVTLTVKADEGYKLDTITVTDKNGNEIKLTDKGDGKYTFTMPASAVTVKASFAKDDTPVETGLPFTDVKADDWFYEAVKYAYDNKLMDGTSSTTFAPLMTTNRAMIVTILWRLEGSPVVNYAMNFSDVESGVWYTEAVRWAAAEGIVKGYSDTVFAPDDTVTREQLATILYRYAGYKEYDVSAKGDLTTFADGSTVSTWAADGMTWAVGAQLITGKDGGKLDPTGTATRAEVATILMRFCENVAK